MKTRKPVQLSHLSDSEFRISFPLKRQMCKLFNEAERIARRISRNNTKLTDEQFDRYEELKNEATLASKSSKAAAYVSIIEC